MTSAGPDAAGGLQRWLIDYLVTEIGCAREDVGLDVAFNDLGVGSRDAVVLSGELATLVGRAVSPLDFWQHHTINELVQYLMAPESEAEAQAEVRHRTGILRTAPPWDPLRWNGMRGSRGPVER